MHTLFTLPQCPPPPNQRIGSLPTYPRACTLPSMKLHVGYPTCTLPSTKLKVVYPTCTLPSWKLNVAGYTTQPKGKDRFINYENRVTLVGRLGRDPTQLWAPSNSQLQQHKHTLTAANFWSEAMMPESLCLWYSLGHKSGGWMSQSKSPWAPISWRAFFTDR